MANPVTKPRICSGPNCENDLSGKRIDAIYCSAQCKLAAYHSRRGINTRRERDHNICQRKDCGKTIPTDLRADALYCSNACRQKVWNENHKADEKIKRDKIRAKHKERKQQTENKKAVDAFIQELMGE